MFGKNPKRKGEPETCPFLLSGSRLNKDQVHLWAAGLTCENLEGQVASLALTQSQREPQPRKCVYQANLLDTAQVHRTQSNICNQLFDYRASIGFRTAVEEICWSPLKLWIGKVFPAERVKGSEDASTRRVLLKRGKAVQRTPSHTICRVENDSAVKLIGKPCNGCIHCRAGYSHHYYIRI